MGQAIAGAVAVAAPILGGIIGQSQASGDSAQSQQLAQQAYNELMAVGLPPDLSKQLIMEKFKSAGKLTPQMEDAINMGPSKVAGIQTDPGLKAAQTSALQLLQQRGKTGLGPEDRAALNQVRDEVQRDTEAKRQQILQNFQQRGQGGSGAELIAALQASQSGSNQASAQGDRLAAQASQNALQALTQSGQLGGQIRGQDFSEAQTKAQAEDAINQFNTQNAVSRQQRNVGVSNQAQAANLANEQGIANQNTSQANQELLRQNQAKQNYYNSLLSRAGMRANASEQLGANYGQRAADTAQRYAGMGSAIGGIAGTAAGAFGKPEAPSASNNFGSASPNFNSSQQASDDATAYAKKNKYGNV